MHLASAGKHVSYLSCGTWKIRSYYCQPAHSFKLEVEVEAWLGSCNAGLADLVSHEGAGKQVAAALASADPVVRMRAVSLVFGLAGQSQSAMEAVQQSGANQLSAIPYCMHVIASRWTCQTEMCPYRHTGVEGWSIIVQSYSCLQAKD